MKARLLLVSITGFVALSMCLVRADDPFIRINTGPGAVPNGSSAVAWSDFNNDGWLDLFVTSFGGTSYNYCYTNNGDGTFTRILPTFFPANNINSFGCAWADYDNDGYLDLVKGISNPFGGPTQLYRNTRNGTFANVTTASIGNVGPGAQNVVWGDYDNDGFVDLFMAVGYNAPDNVLLHNRGDGTFSRVTGNPMVTATGISGGASWGDCDNDGRLDLIVTRTSAGCLLYHNEGGGVFRQITNQVINTDTNTAGVSWGDYDNDGFLDLFVAHMQAPNRLYRNNGDGTFTALTNGVIYQMTGPSSGGAWADYDNDGWLDLFVANYRSNSFLFHNDGNGGFTSVNGVVTEIGTGQGAAWGDYDNDGFPDLLVPNVFTYNNFLYHNNGNSNAWLTLKLEGRISNRAAIGAKVRIRATIQGREVWQLREISGGGSLGSQNDLRAAFGLGDAISANVVRIEWPSGMVQELHAVGARQFLTVVEPEADISPRAQEVQAGQPALFAVASSLHPPVEFQWKFNGVALPGQTNSTFNIPEVQASHAGSYSVALQQPASGLSFETRPALLTGPVLLFQTPTNPFVRLGSNALLRITATGIPPLSYQWRFHGRDLVDATNSTLALTNVQLADDGEYTVSVSNSFGAVTSDPLPLTVLVRPAIVLQPLSQAVPTGGTAVFSVSATGHPLPLTFRLRRNGTFVESVPLATSNCFFTVTNIQPTATTNQFYYTVVVTNLAGNSALSSAAVLTVLADSDGDGLPDNWELEHGLQIADASDASLDGDDDSASNLEEYRAGTNPNDARSILRIESIRYDNSPAWRLQFIAASNRTYSVQATDALHPDWHSLADVPAVPTNRVLEIIRPITNSTARFFRIATPRSP